MLGAADWQISQDADDLMNEMVIRLGGSASEVTVLVHSDHVEMIATSDGRLEQCIVPSHAGFRADVACTQT